MSIERLERVMWRMEKIKKNEKVLKSQLELAIMKECGTDDRTIKMNIKALLKLKWLVRHYRHVFTITGEHLN